MTERSVNKVVNCHWFGGSDKLPPNTHYIGRPSLYGNPYSSKSGKYTREECVALHRVEIYKELTSDPSVLIRIKHDLDCQDLACWCKQPKRMVGCHGDNYLHILSPGVRDRSYDKSVLFYLMEDLRSVTKRIETYIWQAVPQKDFLPLYIHFQDVMVEIRLVLLLVKENFVTLEDLWFFIACIIIDLELAAQDTDLQFIEYRFWHVLWNSERFRHNRHDRDHEPMLPTVTLKRKAKG